MKKNVFLSFIFLFFVFAYTAVSQEVLQLGLVGAQVYATEHNKTMEKADLAIQEAEDAKGRSALIVPLIATAAATANQPADFAKLLSLLAPILILIVGALVGFMVIALLLPIFRMSRGIQ